MFLSLNLCDTSAGMWAFYILKVFISIVCIIIPLIIIVNSFRLLFGSVITADKLKENGFQIMKSVIAGLIVFFIPTMMNFVFGTLIEFDDSSLSECYTSSSIEKVQSLREKEAQEKEEMRKQQENENEEAIKKKAEDEKNDKENMERNEKVLEHNNSNNVSNNSTSGDYFYSESLGVNADYKGHTVNLTDSQKLKVARALMGERSNADLGTYIALCQYIRDYIDYGNVTSRSYDSLGSVWLKSASASRTDYPISWFESNRPYIMQAIDYVFNKGGSAFQGKVTFYIDNADYGSGNENNDSAINKEINSWMNNPNLAIEHGKYMDEHQIIYGENTGGNRSVWVICKKACQTRANLKVIKD